MSATTVHVEGFKALPVKYRHTCKSNHWLYIKEHAVRDKNQGKPAGRTLFVLNVPPHFNEKCLRKLFGGCGEILAVHFHKKPTSNLPPIETSSFFPRHAPVTGFKIAYIVFKNGSELNAALELDWKEPEVVWGPEDQIPSAIERWKKEYDSRIPNLEALQADIEDFMKKHDKEVEVEARQAKKEEGKPDEEGWITVTRKGRKPGFARKESVENKVLAKESKKRAKKELLNFYTFQVRESKMKNLAELRNKFEEDKKRIATLRQSRRFKPY